MSAAPLLEEKPLSIRWLGDQLLFELPRVTAWCEVERGRGGILLDRPREDDLAQFVHLALPSLLIELAALRGWLGLHAAAIAPRGRGVLLPGRSNAGKTTIFQQAARRGLDVLSDDLVWAQETPDGWRLWPYPRRRDVAAPTIENVRLASIVCPSIYSRAVSRIEPASAEEAASVLIGQAGFLARGSLRKRRFRSLVRLASSVPCYRLEAGADRKAVDSILTEVIQGRAENADIASN